MMRLKTERGAAMMEVLVAMLVIAFGVLGFVGLQAQTALAQLEGYQRSQALILANDIAQRMSLNRDQAAAYKGVNIGAADPGDCLVKPTRAEVDLCEWSLLIQGAGEKQGAVKLGAMTGAKACIISGVVANEYLVSVVWQGVQSSGAPATACGLNDFSNENLRRAVTTVVQIGDLAS